MTLTVSHLTVALQGREILSDVSFTLQPGQRLGLIGPSGSGKTMLALAISGLLPEAAEVSGEIMLGADALTSCTQEELARIRGNRIGFVFQEPKSALNPLRTLGSQLTESLTLHYRLTRAQRVEAERRLAALVGLEDDQRLLRSYPHQVSGGQRQRVAIGAALAASPELLIADEPTTALDVTVQAGILALFRELSTEHQRSLLFVSHDIAVLSNVVTDAIVLSEGRVVESGSIRALIEHPHHDVTRSLVTAARRVEAQLEGVTDGGDR